MHGEACSTPSPEVRMVTYSQVLLFGGDVDNQTEHRRGNLTPMCYETWYMSGSCGTCPPSLLALTSLGAELPYEVSIQYQA